MEVSETHTRSNFGYAEVSEKMERSPDAPNADFRLCGRMSSTKPIFRSGLLRKVISDSFVALMSFAIDRDRYTIAIALRKARAANQKSP